MPICQKALESNKSKDKNVYSAYFVDFYHKSF